LTTDARAIVASIVGSAVAIMTVVFLLVGPLRHDLTEHESSWAHEGSKQGIASLNESIDDLQTEIRLLRAEIREQGRN
jgi:hypothetical protein